jgi:hypothetical protein
MTEEQKDEAVFEYLNVYKAPGKERQAYNLKTMTLSFLDKVNSSAAGG